MFNKKSISRVFSVLFVILMMSGTASARPFEATLGTGFTYQGKLIDGSAPANRTYDLEFTLYDALSDGNQVGSTIIQDDVTVTNGLFSVQLDFGNVFDGTALYLETGVRPGSESGAYTTLTPRQPLSAAPYALYATQANNADLLDNQHASYYQDASNINSGTLGATYYSAYADLSAEGYLGNAANDLALNNGALQSTLNADLLDNQHATYYQDASNINAGTLGATYYSAYADLSAEGYLGNAANDLALNNGALQSTLNADLLDGLNASYFAIAVHNHWGETWSGSGAGLTLNSIGGTDVRGIGLVGVSGQGVEGGWGVMGDCVMAGNCTGVRGNGGDYGVYGSGSNSGVYGTSSNYGVYGDSTAGVGNGIGVYGTGGTVGGYGMYGTGKTGVYGTGTTGVSGSGSTYGVYGTASGGAGVYGSGNTGIYGSGGTGVAGQCTVSGQPGIFGRAYNGTGDFAGLFAGNVRVDGNLTVSGSKSAVVDTKDYGARTLYAVESPENWFEDFGTGQLTKGAAVITIEPVFAETVNLTVDYHVFLTPLGDCALYVDEKSPTSFTVRAMGGQTCSIAFDYRIVAKRLGYEDVRLAEANTSPTIEPPGGSAK